MISVAWFSIDHIFPNTSYWNKCFHIVPKIYFYFSHLCYGKQTNRITKYFKTIMKNVKKVIRKLLNLKVKIKSEGKIFSNFIGEQISLITACF